MKLTIKDIVIDPTVQIRRGNHEQTIQRYMESFQKLPPIEVFETPEGLLLSDGFQRVAAARRLGLTEIEANVLKGTREDAAEFAVVANMQNADPLTIEERNDGVRRLKQLHPDWSQQKIADAMSISKQTVGDVLRVDEIRRGLFTPAASRLADSYILEIGKANEPYHQPLVKAAEERGWNRDITRLAVQNLKDDRIPDERKQAILAGEADPVVVTPEGQLAVPADVVGRQIREMAANDAVLALERALEQLAKLRLFRPEAIVRTTGRQRLDRLINEMPGYIAFMEEVLAAAKKESRKLEVLP